MSSAAHSDAVVAWLMDEHDEAKMKAAYDQLAGIIEELYSSNLYIGVESSGNEYRIESTYPTGGLVPFALLDIDQPLDSWYFACLESANDFLLSIGIDHVLQRKRVWLDYRVEQDGKTLGVICTGLEFAHVIGELFSSYENAGIRGLIIDSRGDICMDSSLLSDTEFLYHHFEAHISEEFDDRSFLDAVQTQLSRIDEDTAPDTLLVELSSGPFRYASLSPIKHTDWFTITLYSLSPVFNMSAFLPAIAFILILFLAFVLATSVVSRSMIFSPLKRLVDSLVMLKGNSEVHLYGVERDDEFGELSQTIDELFTKANYDGLTGIYNRRYMESSLQQLMLVLSRSEGVFSVLMMDIDYFKRYNDHYGHEQGDTCLRTVAATLAGCITRATDFVARYGGEEFLVALPNTDAAGAQLIAERMLESVRQLQMPHVASDAAPTVTISIGVTTGVVDHLRSWVDFQRYADKALYMSKEAGRNCISFIEFGGEEEP